MKNLTRDFVAGELEMTYSGYGKIERGEIDITISKISKLADIFGISISDLLFFDVSYFFNNDADEKIDDHLRVVGSNSDVKTLRISRSKLMDFQNKKLKNRV